MNNRDLRRVQALVGHPDFQRFCAQWAATAGVAIPPGVNPAGYCIAALHDHDPATARGFVANVLAEHERYYPPPPATAHDAHDWDRELPPGEVVKAWKALPQHSRLRESAKSPQSEALARHDLAKMGGAPLPGLTAGETIAAYLNFAPRSKALASGDRAAYDSLAARLGGALGDGEGLRYMVNEVTKIHQDDHVLNRIAEKNRAAEAEAAKHRPKPVENPTFHPKHIPQNALKPHEKAPDKTRDEVARQYDRQKAGWSAEGRQRSREPLRMTIRNKLQLDAAMALCKVKGEPYDRVFASIAPEYRRQLVGHLRAEGLEPAHSGSSVRSDDARNWVPVRSADTSSRSEPRWVPAPSNPSSSSDASSGFAGSEGAAQGSDGAAQTGSGT